MKKKLIKLTESDLHNIIRNSVNKIMKESIDDDLYDGDENDEEIEQDIEPEELDDETLISGFGDEEFDGDYENDEDIEQQIKRGAQQGMLQHNDSIEDPQITKIHDMMNKVDSGEELSDEEKEMALQYAKDIYKKSKRGDNSLYWSGIANSLADGTYSQISRFNKRNSMPEIDDEIVGESIRRTLKKMKLI